MAYYETIFGSGFYDCYRYVMKTDHPTTNCGVLIDCLIDYLKKKRHRNIILFSKCKDYGTDFENGHDYIVDADGNQFYSDMYLQGGKYGDILLHYGDIRINEINENEIKDAEIVEVYR